MEFNSCKNSSSSNSIEKCFMEELKKSLSEISFINNILEAYFDEECLKNFNLESELELTKINLKYLENILSCFLNLKSDAIKVKLLKLYDYMSHEFKRFRNKYEDLNEVYFILDEENNFIRNIKAFMKLEELNLTKVGYLYLILLNYYLNKILKKLKDLEIRQFKICKKSHDKFSYNINKLYFMSKKIYTYMIGQEDKVIHLFNNLEIDEINKILSSKLNEIIFDNKDCSKLEEFFKNFLDTINLKINTEKNIAKKIIDGFKNGFFSVLNLMRTNKDKQDLKFNINSIKLLFEAFESKLLYSPGLSVERPNINEVVYISKNKNENLEIFKERDYLFKRDIFFTKIRIVSNQILKINFNNQKFEEKCDIMKEVNFFSLLLKVSKDFLTPNYNVIIHISGGGFFSESSESRLSFLSEWVKQTECVIISLDYKLTQDNKYPILLNDLIQVYEMIVKHSVKFFNFNINKLIIFSDSLGSLIALDIIKHAIKNNIRKPDSSILVCPCPNIMGKDSSFSFFDDFVDDPHLKIREMFIEENKDNYSKMDDRLNFFLTENKIIEQFPNTLIISPTNEPIREDCYRLAEFLKSKNNEIILKHIISYCNGLFQLPFLLNTQYNKIIDICLSYIIDVFLNKKNKISESILLEQIKSRKSSNSLFTNESISLISL